MSEKVPIKTIFLDFGSGETCRNELNIAQRMLDDLSNIRYNKKFFRVIVKWQLFHKAPPPFYPWPLKLGVFDFVFEYAKEKGFETIASVYDEESLYNLIDRFNVPFVKIDSEAYYHLIDLVPRNIPVLINVKDMKISKELRLAYGNSIIPIYGLYNRRPANHFEYESLFGGNLSYSIVDNCVDTSLFTEYQPLFYERAYALNDSVGLDTGAFASTSKQLEKMLCI